MQVVVRRGHFLYLFKEEDNMSKVSSLLKDPTFLKKLKASKDAKAFLASKGVSIDQFTVEIESTNKLSPDMLTQISGGTLGETVFGDCGGQFYSYIVTAAVYLV